MVAYNAKYHSGWAWMAFLGQWKGLGQEIIITIALKIPPYNRNTGPVLSKGPPLSSSNQLRSPSNPRDFQFQNVPEFQHLLAYSLSSCLPMPLTLLHNSEGLIHVFPGQNLQVPHSIALRTRVIIPSPAHQSHFPPFPFASLLHSTYCSSAQGNLSLLTLTSFWPN